MFNTGFPLSEFSLLLAKYNFYSSCNALLYDADEDLAREKKKCNTTPFGLQLVAVSKVTFLGQLDR